LIQGTGIRTIDGTYGSSAINGYVKLTMERQFHISGLRLGALALRGELSVQDLAQAQQELLSGNAAYWLASVDNPEGAMARITWTEHWTPTSRSWTE
jgi:hypothetical protein